MEMAVNLKVPISLLFRHWIGLYFVVQKGLNENVFIIALLFK